MQVGNGSVRKTVAYSRYIQHKKDVGCRRVETEEEIQKKLVVNVWKA